MERRFKWLKSSRNIPRDGPITSEPGICLLDMPRWVHHSSPWNEEVQAYLNACTVEEEVWSTWAPSTAATRILGCTCHRTPSSTRIVEVDPFPAESTRSSPRRCCKSSSEAAVVSCPIRNSSSASVREWGSADSTPIEREVRPSSGHFRTSMSHRRPSTSEPACEDLSFQIFKRSPRLVSDIRLLPGYHQAGAPHFLGGRWTCPSSPFPVPLHPLLLTFPRTFSSVRWDLPRRMDGIEGWVFHGCEIVHPCTPGKPPPMPPPVGATLSVYVSLHTRPMTFGSIVSLRIISSSVPFRSVPWWWW